MNIAVGARAGVIDPLFSGDFLGKDCRFSCILTILVAQHLAEPH